MSCILDYENESKSEITLYKKMLQTSKYKLRENYLTKVKEKCSDWEYAHFTNKEMETYIEQYPITGFPNILSIFKEVTGVKKSDIFRVYYLYLNGGAYMDTDALLVINIETIIPKNSTIVLIKSCLPETGIFTGFMYFPKKHPMLLELICYVHNNKTHFEMGYFNICRKVEELYYQFRDCNSHLLEEQLCANNTEANIILYNNIALTHYFAYKLNNEIRPNVEIGVSVFFGNDAKSILNSGVQQNALFLAELLLNMGYIVHLICDNLNCTNLDFAKYDKRFQFVTDKDALNLNLDIIFTVGYKFLTPCNTAILKQKNTKLIYYNCGNDHFINCEAFCHKFPCRNIYHEQNVYDEIWAIPQFFDLNHYYWKTIYNCPVKKIPFLWSSKLIDKKEWIFEPNEELNNRIAIFEPNISVMKCALPPLLICENAYRNGGKIDKVFVTNALDKAADKNLNKDVLNDFVKLLTLHKENNIFIEGRFHSVPMMKHSAHVAVSHTILNPLNYLYFDLAYMGYAILHNASMCPEIGYYYRENNYEEAGFKLNDIMKNHNANFEEYIIQNRLLLEKYMPHNLELQYKYREVITNILKNM